MLVVLKFSYGIFLNRCPLCCDFDGSKTLSLVVGKHVVKGVVELIRNLLDLQLFPVDLIFNVVNPVVELGDVHLAVLIASLSLLQPLKQLVDLVFQLLLTLGGLFSRDLQLLHVLAHSLQFLFHIHELALCQLSAFSCPLTHPPEHPTSWSAHPVSFRCRWPSWWFL